MQNQNEAFFYGLLLTLLALAAFVLWLQTNDYTPAKRRAIRLAIPVGAACAAGVGLAEWALYKADPIAGVFMSMPSTALAVVVFIFGGLWVYRLAGGPIDDDAELKPDPEAVVEPETRENQGGIWCELRELPHMRERLDGELINLASGDRIYWIEFKNEKCIEILFGGGRTIITATRYKTLTKYLTVQQGLARSLGLLPHLETDNPLAP